MGLSKENAKKLKYLWKDENKIEWIESFIRIVDKDKNIVPFKLTPEQRYFVENMGRENIIQKSRQLGLTSVTIALMIRQCIVYPNSSCLMISYDQKSCNDVFDKLKEQWRNLPKWLKPDTIAVNRQEIKMTNGSKITCACAGHGDLGRGGTKSFVHFTEFAYVKEPERHLSSVRKTLGNNSILILESTANGINLHHNLYFKAKNNEITMKPFFFNWINADSLFKGKYKEAVEDYKALHNGKILTVDDLDEEEKELVKLGATMEQLMFRRKEISTDGLEKFHQEYPSTDLEAFLMTGSSVFDSKRVNEALSALKINKTKYMDKKNIIDLPSLLKQHYGKSFFMWKIPTLGEKYYIGADLSEGLGQDYSVVEVLNQEGQQVAEFYNNKIKPYMMAEIIDAIGRYYNKALICVEKASGGHSCIERLRHDYKYMNMVKYKSYDEFNRVKYEIGFDTNSKTKSLIINDFIELFEKRLIVINSERLLQEMQVFVSENGKMGAISGSHDDSVMAMALAIVALKEKYHYKW